MRACEQDIRYTRVRIAIETFADVFATIPKYVERDKNGAIMYLNTDSSRFGASRQPVTERNTVLERGRSAVVVG